MYFGSGSNSNCTIEMNPRTWFWVLGGLLAHLEVAQQDAWLSQCCYYTWRHRNLKELLVCRNLDSASTMSPTIQVGDEHSKWE